MHREFTDCALLDNSPDENLRKKLTGSDKMRIMTDASTASEVLVSMRSIVRFLTIPSIWDANEADIRNTIIPIRADVCLLIRILPVTREYTFGSIVPTSVTTSVASAICRRSLVDMHFLIYKSRSGMPSGFMGRDW